MLLFPLVRRWPRSSALPIWREEGLQWNSSIDTEDAIPPPTEYERVDLPAEMIYSYTPPYPKFARLAGLEGLVWVQAYVDREGNVRVAQVGKSSGSDLLDEAAVAAAYKNKFKPAIRDGEPVAIWVTYQVRFKLE